MKPAIINLCVSRVVQATLQQGRTGKQGTAGSYPG